MLARGTHYRRLWAHLVYILGAFGMGPVYMPNLHWITINTFKILHFFTGHRVCLGEQLARYELSIFFFTLLRTFRFLLPEGVTEVNTKYIAKVTLQPHPYKVCVIQR